MANSLTASILYLCTGVPFDDTYTDVKDFTEKSAQLDYFLNYSPANMRFVDISYQRLQNEVKGGRQRMSIRVDGYAEKFRLVNYLVFQNSPVYGENPSAEGGRFYYCFVKEVNYINPYNTELIYEIDYYQTYLFDYSLTDCTVEREHTTTDNYFEHILPEPVEIEEYILDNVHSYTTGSLYHYVLLAASPDVEAPDLNPYKKEAGLYSNVYCGLYTFVFDDTNVSHLTNYFKTIGSISDRANIVGVYTTRFEPLKNKTSKTVDITEQVPPIVSNIAGYAFKNNKLLTSQFRFFKMVTAINDELIIKPESLKFNNTANFKIGIDTTGSYQPAEFYYPYLHGVKNNNVYLMLDDIVEGTFTVDSFATWANNNTGTIIASVFGTIAGLASGMGAMSFIPSIASVGMQAFNKNETADTFKGKVIPGNPSIGLKRDNMEVFCYNADYNSLKRADDFFTYYGYRVETVKSPNNRSRSVMNYLKLKDCHIKGKLGVEATSVIKQIFLNGVRIWHSEVNTSLDNNTLTGSSGWINYTEV